MMGIDFKTNKVNRNFNIKVRLYHNPEVFNNRESGDLTPRFFLNPIKLNFIERVGFSNKSLSHGYEKEGDRFYGGVYDNEITDAEVEFVFEDLKQSYPYGYRSSDTSSVNKFNIDFWDNDAYQSHLKSFWRKNFNSIKSHVVDSHKVPNWLGVDVSSLQYIEVDFDEVVKTKHITNVTAVPAVAGGVIPMVDAAFSQRVSYVSEMKHPKCSEKVIDVSIVDEPVGDLNFYLDDDVGKHFIFDTGVRYAIRFVEPWPTGSNGAHIPQNWRLSDVDDGQNRIWQNPNGELQTGIEFTSGNANVFDHESVTHEVTVSNGQFHVDGSAMPNLTLKRGSSYTFSQTGVSNNGHPLYVASAAGGGASSNYGVDDEYCQEQTVLGNYGVDGKTVFKVPFDAPNQLYYNCRKHSGMGGSIAVVDPTTSTAVNGSVDENVFVPGNGLEIYLETGVSSDTYYYYSSGVDNMGGPAFISRACHHKCPYDEADTIYLKEINTA